VAGGRVAEREEEIMLKQVIIGFVFGMWGAAAWAGEPAGSPGVGDVELGDAERASTRRDGAEREYEACCYTHAHCADGSGRFESGYGCSDSVEWAQQISRNEAYLLCNDQVYTYNYECYEYDG